MGRLSGYTLAVAKVLVSIDDALLRRIDEAARGSKLSRSAYLSRIAAEALGEAKGPGASPKVQAAFDRLDELFARNPSGDEDSTTAIRAERDARDAHWG